jgi:threonine dehydrogenase-like Zn-dependent dehydrogenase
VEPDDLPVALAARGAEAGVPLAVEVTGRPEVLGTALDVVAHEGTVLVASWYGTKAVSLPLGGRFHRRRLTIRSTQVSTIPARLTSRWTIAGRRAAAADLLEQLPLGVLATHEYPFREAADAYAAVDRGEEGLIHAALCYG